MHGEFISAPGNPAYARSTALRRIDHPLRTQLSKFRCDRTLRQRGWIALLFSFPAFLSLVFSGCGGGIIASATKAGSLTASPDTVAFGSVFIGQTASTSISLTNEGAGPIQITQASLTGQSFSIAGSSSYPVTINAGGSYNLTVQFKPTAAGTASGQLVVGSSGSGTASPVISLSGTGTLTSTSPELGALGCSITSITGSGTDACTVSLTAPASSNGLTVNLSSSNPAVTVPNTVAVPANATSVGFTANVSSVTSAQAVTVTASAGSVVKTATLQLNAAILALSINATNVAFGDVPVNTPATQTIALTSTGTVPVTVTGATVTGTVFTVPGATFPVTLNPTQQTALNVQFTPATAGAANGELIITSDASANGTVAVGLTGTGTQAPQEVAVSVSPNDASVEAGAAQQFAATVTGTTNTAVTWAVSGTGCNGTACGAISSTGLYTAPASVPTPAAVTITATCGADPGKNASVNVTIVSPLGTTYYVATAANGGNDSWSGLLPSPNSAGTDGPFETLAKAQSAMRASPSIKVTTIRGGTYALSSSWSLSQQDSGELWISYPGETPILDGNGTGAISLANVTNTSFKGLTFRNMAAGGLYVAGGTSLTVRWNSFYNCNQSCISGGMVTNSVIDSNIINGQSPGNPTGNTGNAYSAIMFWSGSSNNQITHNLVENCQGGGIHISAGPSDPPNDNNLIDRNVFRNIETNVVDNGAVYIGDRTHSGVLNRITNNLIDGNGGTDYLTNLTKAIYLDDLTSNVLVAGNICRNCGEFAWQIHGGDHITISNNIFDLSSAGTLAGLYQSVLNYPDYGMSANVIENNLLYFGSSTPASLYQVNTSAADALPAVANQLYFSQRGASISNQGFIVDVSPVYADPLFTNPGGGDYSMPSSSPSYTLVHFQALPTDLGPLPYAP